MMQRQHMAYAMLHSAATTAFTLYYASLSEACSLYEFHPFVSDTPASHFPYVQRLDHSKLASCASACAGRNPWHVEAHFDFRVCATSSYLP